MSVNANSIRIKGLDEAIHGTKRACTGLRAILPKGTKEAAHKLSRIMKENAEFSGEYTTGATKKSIRTIHYRDRTEVGPTTPYSPYLESGTEFMEAQPFVGPSIMQFSEKDMLNYYKGWLRRNLEGRSKAMHPYL